MLFTLAVLLLCGLVGFPVEFDCCAKLQQSSMVGGGEVVSVAAFNFLEDSGFDKILDTTFKWFNGTGVQ